MFIFSVLQFLCATALPMEPVYKLGTVMPGVFKTKHENPMIVGFDGDANMAGRHAAVLKQYKQSVLATSVKILGGRFSISSVRFEAGKGWFLHHKGLDGKQDFISYVVSHEQNWEKFKATIDQTLLRFMEGYSAAEISPRAVQQSTALVPTRKAGIVALNYAQLVEQTGMVAIDKLQESTETFGQYVDRVDPKGSDGKPLPASRDRMAKLTASYQRDYDQFQAPEGKALQETTFLLERNLVALLSPQELAALKQAGIDPAQDSCPMLQILKYTMKNPDKIDLQQFLNRYVGFIPTVLRKLDYNKERMLKAVKLSSRVRMGYFALVEYPWAKDLIDTFLERIQACDSAEKLQSYVCEFVAQLLQADLFRRSHQQLKLSSGRQLQQQSGTQVTIQQQIVASLATLQKTNLEDFFNQLNPKYNEIMGIILQETIASTLLKMRIVELYLDSSTGSPLQIK